MNITKYIDIAVIEGKKSGHTRWNIGAVIVRGNKIIAKGHGRRSGKEILISRTFQISIKSLHAEIDAALKCDPVGATIFVAGSIKKNGNVPISTKPCKNCQKVLKSIGIKDVFWLSNNGIHYMEL